MSRVNCSVYGCHSVYKNNPDLAFHRFPKQGERIEMRDEFGTVTNADKKKLWEAKLKMGKPVTHNMRICSRHFVEEDYLTPSDWGYKKRYLKKTAIPSKNLPISSVSSRTTVDKQHEKDKRLDRLIERRKCALTTTTHSAQEIKTAEALLELGSISDDEPHNPEQENIPPNDQFHTKVFVNAATQTEDIRNMKDIDVQVNTNWTSVSDLIQNDRSLNVLTGIASFQILNFLIHLYSSYAPKTRTQRLSVKERILLVFIKLKLDLTFSSIGILFGDLTVPTCKRIFEETVGVLSDLLTNFVHLPSKEEVSMNIPQCFRQYKKVRLIFDCTEIKVEVPKRLCCRIKLYSQYKKNHTLKFMTGVTPAGLIAYASPSYGGRASDKSIFEQSGVIDNLIPFVDEIMVDKGFAIDRFCEQHGIKIVRPPFLRKQKQFNRLEASDNRRIASARVHVERVNARIKVFRIFKNTFPLHLAPFADDIFLIICGVVNLSSPILRDTLF